MAVNDGRDRPVAMENAVYHGHAAKVDIPMWRHEWPLGSQVQNLEQVLFIFGPGAGAGVSLLLPFQLFRKVSLVVDESAVWVFCAAFASSFYRFGGRISFLFEHCLVCFRRGFSGLWRAALSRSRSRRCVKHVVFGRATMCVNVFRSSGWLLHFYCIRVDYKLVFEVLNQNLTIVSKNKGYCLPGLIRWVNI